METEFMKLRCRRRLFKVADVANDDVVIFFFSYLLDFFFAEDFISLSVGGTRFVYD